MKKYPLICCFISCFSLFFTSSNAFAYSSNGIGNCDMQGDPCSQALAQTTAQCFDRRLDIAHMQTALEYPTELSYMQKQQLKVIRQPNFVTIAADFAIVRPLMIVTTAAGAGLFVASLPFSALGGNVPQVGHALVGVPAHQAFVRCLGCDPSDYGEHNYFGYY